MRYILKARSELLSKHAMFSFSNDHLRDIQYFSYSSFVGHGHLLDMTNSIISDEFNFSFLISEKEVIYHVKNPRIPRD